ncbi:MAG: RNA polymerase sigma factor [Acidimicrobiales bacterium]
MGNQTASRPEGVADQLQALWEAEHRPMLALAYLLLGDLAAAEDVVQDAFAAVAERIGQVDRPGAYLRVTVVNGARRHQRRRSRFSAPGGTRTPNRPGGVGWSAQQDRSPPGGPDDRAALAATVEHAEVLAMRTCLAQISARQREALVLRYFADLSLADTAATMGCPEGTVASHVHRGLAHLSKLLAP